MTSEIREQFLALFVQISFAVQSSDGAVQEEKLSRNLLAVNLVVVTI